MIAVVDDDVSFAEEMQDLLATYGYPAVVVSYPHGSSFELLQAADLLILDLRLAETTGLAVLAALRNRGRTPAVVIVSGSGRRALDHARAVAAEQGFFVRGVLSKPVITEDLLALLRMPSPTAEPAQPPAAAAARDDDELLPHGTTIRVAGTLAYAGCYPHPQGRAGVGHADRLDALFDELSSSSPARALRAAIEARQLLAARGLSGFLVLQLPLQRLLDPVARLEICEGFGHPRQARSHIMLDLGAEILDAPAPYLAAMVDLRLAGYGLLVRCAGLHLPSGPILTQLPMTILSFDIALLRRASIVPELDDVVRETLSGLQRRATATLCGGVTTVSDLLHTRDLGISFVSDYAPVKGDRSSLPFTKTNGLY